MKSYLRAGIGGLLLLTSLAVAAYSFYQVIRTGNCSSGGVYVSKRECPAGTTQWEVALPIAATTGGLSFFLLGAGIRGGAHEPFAPDDEIAEPRPARPYTVPARKAAGMFRLLSLHRASAGESPAPAGDPLVRLERLRALLASGALTPAEFEHAKARILGEL
ncbi:SHOCT domain-containing protein [Embleya sp. NPDC005575]|uniref:SHOCT domain-containing protein n=1 Tax=Embleya sp. NPDC005575 TaxID=3156892 RepID=UPI0033A68F39